jgi:hypothetical protein
MRNQFGSNKCAADSQASFLQGGIVARHLPSADAVPFVERGNAFRPLMATPTFVQGCPTLNLHIPACRPPTDGCTTTTTPTDFNCVTFVQTNCDAC